MEGYEVRRRDASIGGIPILYLGSDREVGRRLAVHEFAGRDLPWAEDRGRMARRFTVRCVVGGPDHDLDAERLEALLESPGPHELVLPHRAPILVATSRARFTEPERETRIQRVSFDAVEAGRPIQPRARLNTAGLVQTAVSAAWDAIRETFEGSFSISGQTQAYVDRVADLATGAASAVSTAIGAIRTTADVVQELAEFRQEIRDLESSIAGSIVSAATTAREFQDALDDALSLPLAPLQVFRELARVAEYAADTPDPGSDTYSRALLKRNQDALIGMVQRSATAARAKALSLATFESSGQAAAFRDEIAAELERAIVAAGDAFADDEARLLRDLRTRVVQDLDVRSARLPALVTFRVSSPVPPIVLAQRLYGDPTREAAIVARNVDRIPNPSAVPFGEDLEVLRP